MHEPLTEFIDDNLKTRDEIHKGFVDFIRSISLDISDEELEKIIIEEIKRWRA